MYSLMEADPPPGMRASANLQAPEGCTYTAVAEGFAQSKSSFKVECLDPDVGPNCQVRLCNVFTRHRTTQRYTLLARLSSVLLFD